MYGLAFPRNYADKNTIVFECISPHFQDALDSWVFAKEQEKLGSKLWTDARLVMFGEDGDRSTWTELQDFYAKDRVK